MRGWCSFSVTVTAALIFLFGILKDKVLEYRTIAVSKPVIPNDPIDLETLGTLPIVSRFMRGVFRTKPPNGSTASHGVFQQC